MHPQLVTITLPVLGWTFAIGSHATLALCGIVATAVGTVQRYRDGRRDVGPVVDATLFGVPLAIFGAAIVGVAMSPNAHWDDVLIPWRARKSMYGGLIGLGVGTVVAAHLHGASLGRLLDAAAPPLAIGQAIGRVGCLLAGCCFGTPTSLPWGIPLVDARGDASPPVRAATAVHPTQLYFVVAALVVATLSWLTSPRRPGDRFVLTAAAFAAAVIPLECLRGDVGWRVLGLSANQWISALILVAGLVWLARSRREARAS